MPKIHTPSPSKVVAFSPYRRPATSTQNPASRTKDPAGDPATYKLNFGSYAGSTLGEVRSSYIKWLIKEKVPEKRADLKAALEVFQGKGEVFSSRKENETPSKARGSGVPLPDSPRTPIRSINFAGTPDSTSIYGSRDMNTSNSRARHLGGNEMNSTPSRGGPVIDLELMEHQDRSNGPNSEVQKYILNFGKHNGSQLSKVPLSYIAWLAKNVMETNRHLKQALIDEGFVDTATGELYECHTLVESQSPAKPKPDPKDIKSSDTKPAIYVLDFGKHQGLTLREVSVFYLNFLAEDCIATRPPLRQTMINLGLIDPSTQKLHTYRSFSRISPFPSIYNSPAVFHDEMSAKPLWISHDDIFKYFEMSSKQLEGLSQVKKRCYYLYHIYELYKRYRGELAAKAAFLKWMRLKHERENDTMIGMGLSGLLYNDPTQLLNESDVMAFMRGVERPFNHGALYYQDEEHEEDEYEDMDNTNIKPESKVKNETKIKDEYEVKQEPKVKREVKIKDEIRIKAEE